MMTFPIYGEMKEYERKMTNAPNHQLGSDPKIAISDFTRSSLKDVVTPERPHGRTEEEQRHLGELTMPSTASPERCPVEHLTIFAWHIPAAVKRSQLMCLRNDGVYPAGVYFGKVIWNIAS